MRVRRHQGEDKKRANDPMEMLFEHALPPLIGNSEAGYAKRNWERQTYGSAGIDARPRDRWPAGWMQLKMQENAEEQASRRARQHPQSSSETQNRARTLVRRIALG